MSNASFPILIWTELIRIDGWAGADWKGARSQQRWIGVGALLLVLSVWRALRLVRLCFYYFPGRFDELLFQKSFILFFFLLAVFFNWGDPTRSRSSTFFWSFLSTRKGRARNCSVIKSARALALLFLLYSKNKKQKKRRKRNKKEDEGESGRIVWLRRAPVSCEWNEKRRSADFQRLTPIASSNERTRTWKSCKFVVYTIDSWILMGEKCCELVANLVFDIKLNSIIRFFEKRNLQWNQNLVFALNKIINWIISS